MKRTLSLFLFMTLAACANRNQLIAQKLGGEQRLVRSNFAQDEITQLCDQAITKAQKRIDALVKSKGSPHTAQNTLLPFEQALADFSDETTPLTFMNYVSPDLNAHKEATDCEQKTNDFSVKLFTRRDLFQALSQVKVKPEPQKRLLKETLESFINNGLNLSDDKLAQVRQMKMDLAKIETQFSAYLNADKTNVVLSEVELAGVPDGAKARYNKDAANNFLVTTKETDYVAIMQNASSAETRKKMLTAYLNRAPLNTKLLEEAVKLRAQIASLMGYQSWADYRTASGHMAKSGHTVLEFLNNLKGKLVQRNQTDFAQLLHFKRELDPQANKVDQWDTPYLSYQLQKRDFKLDNEKISEYFPAGQVVAGMFKVYSQLLGVEFVEVKNAKTWSPDVQLYEIHESRDKSLIGYFYTDFVPRENKYNHAAAFPLIAGRLVNGKYSLPVSAIVANLTPPSNGKPSLLSHEDVKTIFHEFGHIMHQTLTRAPYASLSGSGVARDFVEAPSQMLENWVWAPEILSQLSGHYLDVSQKLPNELLTQMIRARDFGQGIYYTRQLLYALFDMKIHTEGESVDVTKTYDSLYREVVGQEPILGGHFAAGFNHLMGGYDSGYYGYLWSEIYAQDMFTRFEADLLSANVGHQYRVQILEQGNMRDAIELLTNFLGREPSSDAFFKKLHLQ